ncbi:hypothetical protein, partial [Mesorhizobium sp. M1C.F.Ca.ET.196.01.1.1]|uniref:hypothetical protein n=1 Tax=Mesorhizobium sp. M1C.F.Ca.ET.196.01.1.1 TaxID=2563928 RepID=UPI001AEE1370
SVFVRVLAITGLTATAPIRRFEMAAKVQSGRRQLFPPSINTRRLISHNVSMDRPSEEHRLLAGSFAPHAARRDWVSGCLKADVATPKWNLPGLCTPACIIRRRPLWLPA